jgi:hypothetical protein
VQWERGWQESGNGACQSTQVEGVGGFSEDGIGAQAQAGGEFFGIVRAGKHDDGELGKFAFAPDPGEDFETVGGRHFEVEQEEGRERVSEAVGVLLFAVEVTDGFEAVLNEAKAAGIWALRRARLMKNRSSMLSSATRMMGF